MSVNKTQRRGSRLICMRDMQTGFGLLEAIVAMVILGTSGLMLFSWLNQNLTTASRLKEAESRARLQLEGAALLSQVNPALEPEGEREQGGLRLRWKSVLVEPMRDEYDLGGMVVPRWRIGLYRVDSSVKEIRSGQSAAWQQVMAGWRNRAAADPAFGLSPERR